MIPLHMLVSITGVSGSGKSTLVHDVIYKSLEAKRAGVKYQELCDRIEEGISNLARASCSSTSRRSGAHLDPNPSTYLKAFDAIREAFASTHGSEKARLLCWPLFVQHSWRGAA